MKNLMDEMRSSLESPQSMDADSRSMKSTDETIELYKRIEENTKMLEKEEKMDFELQLEKISGITERKKRLLRNYLENKPGMSDLFAELNQDKMEFLLSSYGDKFRKKKKNVRTQVFPEEDVFSSEMQLSEFTFSESEFRDLGISPRTASSDGNNEEPTAQKLLLNDNCWRKMSFCETDNRFKDFWDYRGLKIPKNSSEKVYRISLPIKNTISCVECIETSDILEFIGWFRRQTVSSKLDEFTKYIVRLIDSETCVCSELDGMYEYLYKLSKDYEQEESSRSVSKSISVLLQKADSMLYNPRIH